MLIIFCIVLDLGTKKFLMDADMDAIDTDYLAIFWVVKILVEFHHVHHPTIIDHACVKNQGTQFQEDFAEKDEDHESILLLVWGQDFDLAHQQVLFLYQRDAAGESATALHCFQHLVQDHQTCLCSESIYEMKGFTAWKQEGRYL